MAKKPRRTAKGTRSGLMISILVHAAAFFLAGVFVIFSVVDEPESKFVAPKPVERPKMKLKKPKVQARKTTRPKASNRIVSKVRKSNMPTIDLPELGSMAESIGADLSGVELAPDIGSITVFGGMKTIGNDFEGAFYDLKRDRRGGVAPMDQHQCREVLRDFVVNGWNRRKIAKYYQSPQKLYTTHFMIPPIVSPLAPDAFGAPETESYYFFLLYRGKLVYKEDIRFRFWGVGDAYVFVRVDGRDVLINCWDFHRPFFDWWQTSSADSGKFYLGNQTMHVGDWIELKAGEPVEMEVLFGEWRSGDMSAMLLVEVDGEEYPQTRQGGPLLPAFKTEDFSLDMLEEIYKHLPEGECTLTNGPVFRDF